MTTLDPTLGGVVSHVTDLAVMTTEAGATVTIVTPKAEPRPSSLTGTDTPRVIEVGRPRWKGVLLSRPQLDRVIGIMSTGDVIHLHEAWTPANLQIARQLTRRGIPYVTTPHGMLDEWCLAHHPIRKMLYLRLFGQRFYARAQRVFLCAEGERRQSERWLGGTPTTVIPAPMDLAPYRSLPGVDLARSNIPGADGDDPVILFLSRVDPKKGLEVLIDAAQILSKKGTRFRVLVVGSGDRTYVESLHTRINAHGVADQFVFPGFVRGVEKVSLYQRASVFVLPTHQENFGLVLTESLAARTPVITTRGVDIWPDIDQHRAGLIVDRDPASFADAIEQVLSDPQRAAAMGDAGRAWVLEAMDPKLLSSKFLEDYKAVAAAR